MRICIFLFAVLLAALCASSTRAQVSYDQIVHTARQPENWVTYSGDYSGTRYSELKQIDTKNV